MCFNTQIMAFSNLKMDLKDKQNNKVSAYNTTFIISLVEDLS